MFSLISVVSSCLPQPINSRFRFPPVNELGSRTLLWDHIAYKKTPLSFGEYNKILGLFLIHQEIDSAQHRRLGKVIFKLRPTQPGQ